MIEVDRLMIEEFGIQLLQMMENAGRNLADLAGRLLGSFTDRRITVLSGAGNNGGGGLVAARHLHNRGAQVSVFLAAEPGRLKEVTAQQWRTLQKIGIPAYFELISSQLQGAELILDALLGYGVRGNPHGLAAEWIRLANASRVPVLALDAPSGLDTTTGKPGDPCIRANATLTLALPKTGLLEVVARPFVGELYLADISVPRELYRRMGIEIPPLFDPDPVIRITD
jgi:NAD(P)H-hydrate epimerase